MMIALPRRVAALAAFVAVLSCSYTKVEGQIFGGGGGSVPTNFADPEIYSAFAENLMQQSLNDLAVEVLNVDDSSGLLDILPPGSSMSWGPDMQDYGIIGGNDVVYDRTFPWYVQFTNDRCGGTMIWPGIVMTAASCIINGIPSAVKIGPLTDKDGDNPGIEAKVVAGYYYYGFFNTYPLTDNIAVLVLNIDDIGNEDLETVSINVKNSYPSVNTPVSAIGFGATSAESINTRSPTLQQLNSYSSVSQSDCLLTWQDVAENTLGLPRRPLSTDANVCAAAPEGSGVCRGDGGGPLFDSNFIQLGITSFGAGCATGNPDVFTRVSFYNDWLFRMVCLVAPRSKPGLCLQQEQKQNDCGTAQSVMNWVSSKVPALKGFFAVFGGNQ